MPDEFRWDAGFFWYFMPLYLYLMELENFRFFLPLRALKKIFSIFLASLGPCYLPLMNLIGNVLFDSL